MSLKECKMVEKMSSESFEVKGKNAELVRAFAK